MKLPPLQIGNLIAKVPIMQGGMGVGVSLSGLASAVAREGGIGIISGAQVGFKEEDFETNCLNANIRALKKEIRNAKKLSNNGIIGVNLMVAMNHYDEMVNAALDEKIDLIVSGAGLPMDLPKLTMGSSTKIAPIVSSARAANIMCKLWDRRYKYVPDMIVVEGPEAGGHLGFHVDELEDGKKPELGSIVEEVVKVAENYGKKYNKKIPVAAGGGVFTGKDIAYILGKGASGVQMATRFVATEECDADINFKMAYVNSKKEDIKIIKSPVGMPGRAIENDFIKKTEKGRIPVNKCYHCIKTCDAKTTPYCITRALIESVEGRIDNGIVFVGSNAYRVDKIVTVHELMSELVKEAENYYLRGDNCGKIGECCK